jgi:tripartite-type tricarboxylate transporter receptor subunit TctC
MQQVAMRGLAGLTALVCMGTACTAQTDGYPAKPVSIITQTPAGSGPDVVARIVADRFAQFWGQPVTITIRPGAAGLIATQAAAAAAPDGYTLFMPTVSAMVIAPEIQPKFPVDFDKAFLPIGIVGGTPMAIAVASTLGVDSLSGLVALAKKRPGEIMFAGNNRGAFPHLTGELLKNRAGIDLRFIPYPGAAAALRDVLGGRISVMVESPSAIPGAFQARGELKAVAVTAAKRLSTFPDVPTVSETIPGFSAVGWFALLAPAGTPDAVVSKLSRDLNAVLGQPEVARRFEELGVFARRMSRDETAQFIRRERDMWRPVVKGAGLTVE